MKAEIQGVTIETKDSIDGILTVIVSKADVIHSVTHVYLNKKEDDKPRHNTRAERRD